MQLELRIGDVRIFVDMINATGIETRRTTNGSVDFVPLASIQPDSNPCGQSLIFLCAIDPSLVNTSIPVSMRFSNTPTRHPREQCPKH